MTNLTYIIGVGVTKCGTSSLSQFISNSPIVESFVGKESEFFNLHYERGIGFYDSLFEKKAHAQFRLDFTPGYFAHRDTIQRIAAFGARKKILICLRHPVERAYSHYIYHLSYRFSRGLLPNDLSAQGFIKSHENTAALNDTLYLGFGDNFFDLISWPRLSLVIHYAPLLEQCFSVFGRENVCVLIMDHWLAGHPAKLSSYLNSFLEADLGLDTLTEIPRDNRTSMPFYLMLRKNKKNGVQHAITSNSETSPTGNDSEWHDVDLGVVVDGKIEIIPASPKQILDALRGSALWTDFLPADYAQRLHELYFEDDTKRVEDLLDIDLTAWRRFRDLRYPRKMPPASEMLGRLAPMPDRPLTG